MLWRRAFQTGEAHGCRTGHGRVGWARVWGPREHWVGRTRGAGEAGSRTWRCLRPPAKSRHAERPVPLRCAAAPPDRVCGSRSALLARGACLPEPAGPRAEQAARDPPVGPGPAGAWRGAAEPPGLPVEAGPVGTEECEREPPGLPVGPGPAGRGGARRSLLGCRSGRGLRGRGGARRRLLGCRSGRGLRGLRNASGSLLGGRVGRGLRSVGVRGGASCAAGRGGACGGGGMRGSLLGGRADRGRGGGGGGGARGRLLGCRSGRGLRGLRNASGSLLGGRADRGLRGRRNSRGSLLGCQGFRFRDGSGLGRGDGGRRLPGGRTRGLLDWPGRRCRRHGLAFRRHRWRRGACQWALRTRRALGVRCRSGWLRPGRIGNVLEPALEVGPPGLRRFGSPSGRRRWWRWMGGAASVERPGRELEVRREGRRERDSKLNSRSRRSAFWTEDSGSTGMFRPRISMPRVPPAVLDRRSFRSPLRASGGAAPLSTGSGSASASASPSSCVSRPASSSSMRSEVEPKRSSGSADMQRATTVSSHMGNWVARARRPGICGRAGPGRATVPEGGRSPVSM